MIPASNEFLGGVNKMDIGLRARHLLQVVVGVGLQTNRS